MSFIKKKLRRRRREAEEGWGYDPYKDREEVDSMWKDLAKILKKKLGLC